MLPTCPCLLSIPSVTGTPSTRTTGPKHVLHSTNPIVRSTNRSTKAKKRGTNSQSGVSSEQSHVSTSHACTYTGPHTHPHAPEIRDWFHPRLVAGIFTNIYLQKPTFSVWTGTISPWIVVQLHENMDLLNFPVPLIQ